MIVINIISSMIYSSYIFMVFESMKKRIIYKPNEITVSTISKHFLFFECKNNLLNKNVIIIQITDIIINNIYN